MTIAFIDLAAQQARLRDDIDNRLAAILDHGGYIMGGEVYQLEEALAKRIGRKHAISCSSGTDALILGLLGLGVKLGDGVIVPSFTFAASVEAIAVLGAIPVFAEVEACSFNLDPSRIADALAAGVAAGVNMVGMLVVDLFGQPARLDELSAFAEAKGLWLLDDAAQSFGASWKGLDVCRYGRVSATSFFPAKPLGCYGDGGALFTDDDQLAEIAISCRVHGQGRDKYENKYIGMTARLDTMQAAILLSKLTIFDDELVRRQQVAMRYQDRLGNVVAVPRLSESATSSWAQYVIKLPEGVDRDDVHIRLKNKGIPTAIYYPRPMHIQAPYSHYPITIGGLEVTDMLADRVLALPMHPYLDDATQEVIVEGLKSVL